MAGGGDEGERARVLLRINAELAAEIRNLTLGHADAPRTSLLTATRGIASAVGERDAAVAALDLAKAEIAELRERNDELRELVERQVAELERLRSGPLGVVRRAKARLLRRRATRDAGA